MHRIASLILIVASTAGVAACGSASGTAGPKAGPIESESFPAERYFPLKHDTVYAFATSSEDTGDHGVLMMQVTRPRPGRIDLTVGGRVQRLESRPDGIAYATGGYLLKAPIETGSSWKGHAGAVTVVATDAEAQVPAGRFVGCVKTVEEAVDRGAAKKITSLYCPDVGLVALEVEAASDEGFRQERAELQSFGPRVDLEAEAR